MKIVLTNSERKKLFRKISSEMIIEIDRMLEIKLRKIIFSHAFLYEFKQSFKRFQDDKEL